MQLFVLLCFACNVMLLAAAVAAEATDEEHRVMVNSYQHLEGLLAKGRTADASSAYDAMSLSIQQAPYIQINVARIYAQRGDFKTAEEVIEKNVIGSLLSVMTERSGAAVAAADILQQEDMTPGGSKNTLLTAYLTLAKLYLTTQRHSEGRKKFELVLQHDPNNYQALLYLGKLLFNEDSSNAENLQRVVSLMSRAYELQPNDERLLFEYGMVMMFTGSLSFGRQLLQQAAAVSDSVDYKLFGKIYLHYQQIEWAAEAFALAFIQQMGTDAAIIQQFYNQFNLHQLAARSTQGSGFDAETTLILAECSDQLGRNELAEALYRLTLQYEPQNPLAHTGLALMLLGTGNRNYAALHACGLHQEQAIMHLRTALSVKPDLHQAASALEFCEKEISEAKQWRHHVQQMKNASTALDIDRTVNTDSIATRFSIDQLIPNLIRNVLAPVSYILRKVGMCTALHRSGIMGILCGQQMSLASCPVTGDASCSCNIRSSDSRELECSNNEANSGANMEASAHKIQRMRQNWYNREVSIPSTVPVVSLDGINDCVHDFMLKNQPALIKNFQQDWGRSSSYSNNAFTREALQDTFGDALVRVSVSESGRFDGPEAGHQWGISTPGVDVLVRPPTTSMLFGDFLSLVHESTAETFYLEYLALHQYLGQDFLDLIPLPKALYDAKEAKQLDHLVTNLWIGGRPTVSPLHYDDYENFLCQIAGEKELILFPPTDIEHLYYIGRPKGILSYTYPGNFTRDPETVDHRGFVFGSSVNIDAAPEQLRLRFPKFQHASPQRVVLKPGDVLYLPAYWHHEVQSIPDAEDGLNIAVNYWFANLSAPIDDVKLLGLVTPR